MQQGNEQFQGFSKETFQFLLDIRFHNEKTWFEENRETFVQFVKQPLEALAADLAPYMLAIDPELDVRPARVVSRVYRDARYAKGIPYRDNMWLSFKPHGMDNSTAFTYYVYIEADQWGYGMGYYSPVKPMMDAFRQRILREPELFTQTLHVGHVDDFELVGEDYRRLPKIELPDELTRWYNKKVFYLSRAFPITPMVYSPNLGLTVADAFWKLAPLYCFLWGRDVGDMETWEQPRRIT